MLKRSANPRTADIVSKGKDRFLSDLTSVWLNFSLSWLSLQFRVRFVSQLFLLNVRMSNDRAFGSCPGHSRHR